MSGRPSQQIKARIASEHVAPPRNLYVALLRQCPLSKSGEPQACGIMCQRGATELSQRTQDKTSTQLHVRDGLCQHSL